MTAYVTRAVYAVKVRQAIQRRAEKHRLGIHPNSRLLVPPARKAGEQSEHPGHPLGAPTASNQLLAGNFSQP